MPNVLVRDLPDEAHAGLRRRAEQRGQSLQPYLAAEIRRLAEKRTLEEGTLEDLELDKHRPFP